MRRLVSLVTGATLALTVVAGVVGAGGPPSLAFYVDDVRYRTVATPTDFAGTGAPAHTYDTIYALGPGLVNVAEARPGDRDFNGGRWAVRPIEWHTTAVQLTNDADILAWEEAGLLSIGDPVRYFFCSVSPVPPGRA